EAAVDAVDASDLEALPDDGQPGVAGEGAATGAEFDVGHGTVWVNGDIRYIAMQFSRLEAFLGAISRIQEKRKTSVSRLA
ncbi:MAG: hypothetical protein CML16_01605, partial [Pusillimonas sp.]|nr:hypothetical protein [Pusillimonas sp.]